MVRLSLLLMLIAPMNFCEGQTGGLQNEWSLSGSIRGWSGPGISDCEELVFKTKNVERFRIRKDTLIPTQDTTLRKLLTAAEERNNLKRQVKNLEEQIRLLSDVIKEHNGKDEVQEEFYKNQMTNLKQQLDLAKQQADVFEGMWKKERRKRKLITFSGILTTGAAIFLSLKN